MPKAPALSQSCVTCNRSAYNRNTNPSISVLLIEDNESDYVFLRQMFKEINNELAIAYTLELKRVDCLSAAKNILEEEEFDIILLDLSLPDAEANETLSRFQAITPAASVIVISGFAEIEVALRSVNQGAQDYLVKGRIDSQLLLRSILYAYERRQRSHERKRMEAQLQHSERLKSLGLFAGGIAHDFNNLLMSISASLELLHRAPSREAGLRHIERAQTALRVATSLVRQLLAYSGRSSGISEAVDLPGTISSLEDLLRSMIKRGAELSIVPTPDLPAFMADPTQISQVIMNLVLNASDALQGDSGTIEVSMGSCLGGEIPEDDVAIGTVIGSVRRDSRYTYVQIKDSGVGMSEATRQQIFNPFYSTKAFGRGLGLSAVWGIVANHDGIILIESRLGEGTTFKVYFPCADTLSAKQMPASPAFKELSVEASPTEGVILLVDDDEMVRTVTKELLEQGGYSVLSAASGPEAIELFKANRSQIRAAMLDLTMPGMGGEKVFKSLLEIEPDLAVIFMSGLGEPQELADQRKSKNFSFIGKPFSLQALLAAVQKTIGAS